jgi:tetratricopeptide (TPR) repeat protein
MPRPVAAALLALALAASVSVVPQARHEALGRIEFPTSQSGAAQEAFLRGVLLLHSFEYDDAKEAFQQAQKAAPDFAMAYWGEAMTFNHPLWAQTAPEPAREALARLAATREQRLAKAANDKERDWLRAVEALYGEGEKLPRDTAYAAEMRRMAEKYADDLEVKAFYALSLLGTSHGGRDTATYMKAAAIAEDVVRANPQHPGAIHYLIHAYDDPAHAPLGLRYAEAYAKIAPSASHALHMPSHIYFALGMWDKASELNERSVKAADERVARKGLGVDDRGFHALLWLTYSYLQQGRQQDARGVLAQIERAAAESGSVRTRSHLALARAEWLIETRRWSDAKPDGVNPEGLGADATAADLFAVGMAAFRSGNRAAGNDALQRMATLAGDGDRPVRSVTTAKPTPAPRAGTSRPGVTPMPTPRPALPTPAELMAAQTAAAGQPQMGMPAAGAGNDKRVAAIMAQQLEAVLISSEGRRDEGLVLARQAAAVEDDLSFEFGPPLPVKPGHELVGDLLMDVRRPGEAVVAYEASLTRYPGRALSLLGLYRAATASRQPLKAQQAAAELRKVWQRADKTLPELREIAAVPPPSSF